MQFYNSIILLIRSEHLEKFCVFCFGFHIGFSTYSCHKAPAVEHGIALLTNHDGHWNIFSAADFLEHIFCCRFSWDIFSWNIFFLQHIFTAYFLLFYPSQLQNQSCSVPRGASVNAHKIILVQAMNFYGWPPWSFCCRWRSFYSLSLFKPG